MTIRTPRPLGLEHKGAPAMLAPRPSRPVPASNDLSGVTEVDGAGHVVALVAVTGIEDDVQDVIEPGAFRRSLRERKVRGVLGHDWNRPVAIADEVVELMPGDHRLPATAPDGTPWPPEAGALRVTARYLLATKDGREAYEVAKAFGTQQGFSIGYKVTRARQRGRVRHIDDLELYEFSPVLHGANRYATLQAIKSGAPVLERKSTAGVLPRRRRVGSPVGAVADCSACGRPTAAVVGGGLRSGESLLCAACVRGAYDDVRAGLLAEPGAETGTAIIRPDELAEADGVTAEGEYADALGDEIRYVLERHGVPVIETDDPARTGRAWTRRPPPTTPG